MSSPQADDLTRRLAAPFDPADVKFKPQAVKGNRALAIAYADVRAVMDRLDEVIGAGNWSDDYRVLPDNSVVCRLTLAFPTADPLKNRRVRKTDVGSPSEQPDSGDRLKAAFSDALKRAAVKFGVGRYLYRLPQTWCDYDPVKKQFATPPRLPDWAAPKTERGATGPRAPEKQAPPTKTEPPKDAPPAAAPPAKRPVVNNIAEFVAYVRNRDAQWASEGMFRAGDLVNHLALMGAKAGWGTTLADWPYPGCIEFASEETKAFLSGLPEKPDAGLKPNKTPPTNETQQALIANLKACGFQWNQPGAKERMSKIIGREIPANAGPMYLSDEEGRKIVAALIKAKESAASRS